jgi:hypothetical protein
MKIRVLLAAVLLLNAAIVLLAVAPGLVTYAEISPTNIACSICGSPEVQKALSQAASFGRGQVQGHLVSNAWLLTVLALMSTAATIAMASLVRGLRCHPTN